MRINHNITAQLASVNLQKNDGRVSKSLEKLSSGYKITKAADDSAGLAISNKMRTQIRALDQASRNAQDGQSIVETADGALNEITSILQRVRELSVQAANDTNTLDDRSAAQAEIDQMLDEIDRISSTTEFNGKFLLDGSSSRSMISDNDKVKALSVSMSVKPETYEFTVNQIAKPAMLENISITAADTYVTICQETIHFEPGEDIDAKLIDICDKMNIEVIKPGGGSNYTFMTKAAGGSQYLTCQTSSMAAEQKSMGTEAAVTLTRKASPSDEGFSETANYKSNGNNITIIDNGGFEMLIEIPAEGRDENGNPTNISMNGKKITMDVYDAGYMDMQIGANESQSLSMNFKEISCSTLSLRTSEGNNIINVGTNKNATNAIAGIDNAIEIVNAARSELGAYENRLESTSASLDVGSYNMTNSMSRIIDTDMAEEMTNYTQLTVLQQAATAMLSQANNRPKEIMNLLQGM